MVELLEKSSQQETKRFPTWIQIAICSFVLILSLFIGITMIGKAEYDKQWCLSELEKKGIVIGEEDDAALLRDYLHTYTKSEKEEGVNTIYDTGCCKVPKGAKRIRRSENCIYTPNYKGPTIEEKITQFLKRFK